MQSVLILVAPALFAASIYMLLSRIIQAAGGFHLALIKQKWLTKIFVCGDILSFLMQGSGMKGPFQHVRVRLLTHVA